MSTMRELPKVSPAPNWDAIFTARPDLQPPGYKEAVGWVRQNPRIKAKDKKAEDVAKKKKKKKLGRGQKA